MISLKEFTDVVTAYQSSIEYLDKLNDLNIDIFESPLCNSNDLLLDKWIEAYFTEDGAELLYWWLFENVDKVLYEKDNIEIPVDTIEEFYNYLTTNGYQKNS